MFKLFALSGLGLAAAQSAGNVTTLCQSLVTGYCQWTDMNQTTCETLFTNFTAGWDNDTAVDTIGCRQHYASLADANNTAYCNFASPTGGGVCGKPVQGACRAIVNLCGNTQYADTSACETTLAGRAAIPGSKLGSAAAGDDSLECRVYHATVGFTGGANAYHCNHTAVNSTAYTPCTGPVAVNAGHHCTQLQTWCTGSNQQYISRSSCLRSFATYNSTAPVAATNNNDQGSRQYHGVAAVALGDNSHCQHAGPTGGGALGGTYQTWANLAGLQICKTAGNSSYGYLQTSVSTAFWNWSLSDLQNIVPQQATGVTTYSTQNPPTGTTFNTEICRIYHLTVAADSPSSADTHCPHGAVVSATCGNPLDVACSIILGGCPTAYNGSASTCSTTLAALNMGDPNAMAPSDDSIACRVYNAGAALAAKARNSTLAVTSSCNNVAQYGGCGGNTTQAPTTQGAPTNQSPAATLVASAALALLPLFL